MKQTLNSAIGGLTWKMLYLSLRAKLVGVFTGIGGYIGGNVASGIWERL